MSGAPRVLDPGPIPYVRLPLAGDEDLERQLDARYGGSLDLFYFRRVELPLALVAERLLDDPDAYLEQEEGEDRRRIAAGYQRAYRAGEDPPPIVVVCEQEWDILDGYHRGCGALAAGRDWIEAFELLPD